MAARQGDLDIVKHLVDEGDDINSKDKNGVRMNNSNKDILVQLI